MTERLATPAGPRRAEIAAVLRRIFSRVLRIDPRRLEDDAPFLELGADSLALVEALRGIQESFGVKMTIRQLFEQVPTIAALAAFLDASLPAEAAAVAAPVAVPAPAPAPAPVSAVAAWVPPPAPVLAVPVVPEVLAAPPAVGGSALERLLLMQLEAFNQMVQQQLQLLAGGRAFAVPQTAPSPTLPRSAGEGAPARPVEAPLPPAAPTPSPLPAQGPSPPALTAPLDLPLTEAQVDLYTVAQLGAEASMAYNEAGAVELRGPLDLALLRRAVQAVVDRHEALRTVIPSGEAQRVLPGLDIAVPVTDASAYPREEHAALAEAWLAEESRRPFDLAAGPLFRAAVLRLEEERHLLNLLAHHIVIDGLSVALVMTEVMAIYAALHDGGSPGLEPPLPFRDYVGWLDREVAAVEAAADAYWRQVFADGAPVFEPPTDRPRPTLRSFRGRRTRERMEIAESTAARRLGQRHRATLFVTLLAAWSALLHRWTGQDDLVIGVPTSRRPLEGSDALVGLCTDVAPVRSRLPAGRAFAGHLDAVRRGILEAHDQEAYPLSRIVRALDLPRDPGRGPLVNNIFNMDQAFTLPESGGLAVGVLSTPITHVKFDFIFQPLDSRDGVSLELDSATALFDEATALRLLGRLRALLAAAAADPGLPVDELPVLAPAEREQILRDWSGTAGIRPAEVAVPELVAAAAARTPEAVALETADGTITYAELMRRSARLAWHLRGLGVGPEMRVGVCLERSVDLVVALLAVLQAGGAFVPLDPDYPQERLEWMLEDSGAPVLLTVRRLADELPVFLALVVALDEEPDAIARQPETAPPVEIAADSLAYLMYTSGSTGRPKAVAVPHRGIVRLVREASCARLDPGETLALFAPASFDASTLEIWGALANGARLVVPPAGPLSPAELAAVVERHGVTTLWLTSALFQQVAADQLPRLRSVRQLLTGGDVMPPETARRCLCELPGLRLSNCYGPTENTTFTSTWPLDGPAEVPAEGWGVPIGAPIAGTDLYVVDRELRAVPAGSHGELVTGGEGLARGYHERPDLTAERFVPHPFAGRPGARVYRTGDRVRFRSDGAVEFLGRLDRQVKVRGFRIEPGEVEGALARHPAVREAAVTVRRSGAGDERLVAFVTRTGGPEADGAAAALGAELRAALGASLPPYMVPSEIAVLAAMPLTPSGKLDRRALAGLELQAAEVRVVEAPRNAVEEILAGSWAEILRRDPIGIRDSFFDIGGHSLLATQALSRIRASFGVEVPLAAFFADPTVAGVAAVIEKARRQGDAAAAEPIRRAPRDRPLPLSFAQQRLWFFDRFDLASALYNVPLRVRLRGALQLRALDGALAHVFLRHESLRTVFADAGGQPVQVVRPDAPPLPLIDLGALPEPLRAAESARLDQEDAVRPFDLAAGPLLRAALVRLEPGHHRLFLHLHHITSDAWSIAILGNELAAFYRTLAAGGRITEDWPLPPLPIQYADFAAWQRGWFQEEVLERQVEYWREALAGAPAALELPADLPRPAVQSFRGAIEPAALPAPLVEGLERLGRRRGATLFMTLLAGYAAVLARYSGQDDLLIGTPVANRNRSDLEGLIGFFVNTLVLRLDLSGAPTFGELLDRVRESALGAYAHQDLPFERLVEMLAPERDLARNALFQVAFALQNAPMPDLAFGPGLAAALEDTRTDTSKFDFAISLQEPYSGERDGGLVGEVEYSTDLFAAGTVRRFLAHYRTLLEGVLADPEARVEDLPLLGAEERRQIVVGWNPAPTATPRDGVLHRMFEAWARRTPEALALNASLISGGVPGGEVFTYGELNRRANRLAWRLRDAGLRAGEPVALQMERSAEMIVALLAVLKAGGAYVPLDPSDPVERLRFLLADSGARLRLGRETVAAALAEEEGRDDDLPGDTHPESLAYVIYTSGSTGHPKGVAVPHRAVPRLALDNLYLPLGPDDRIAHLSNTAFDASVLEIWTAFLNGAAVVVIPREVALSPESLATEMDRHGVTAAFLTTALFQAFTPVALQPGKTPRALRSLMFGGEAADPVKIRAAFEAAPAGLRLMNAYGPTESTAFTTWYDVGPDCRRWPAGLASVPIGTPIAATRVHVLDPGLRPVPAGVPGELYIGGDGLARGYHGRPDLTAERFVPDPLAGETGAGPGSDPGGRLYRTGDRVRYLAEGRPGTLEFLGRLDQQIKLRGFRVELGEIETALGSHPGVAAAVVSVRESGGDRSLAAYVVRAADAAVEAGELRSWLEARLPAYMLPARFAFLDRLPLTPSGKIDRRALAAVAFEEVAAASDDTAAPRSPVEEVVAALWRELLELEQVGLRSNFFEIGGHSLLATVLLSRLRAAFGVDVTLVAFFQDPTVAGLAHRVAEARAESAPPLDAGGFTGEYPLSFGQERLWFFDRLAPGLAVYNTPIRYRIHGPVDDVRLAAALEAVIRRHEVLRSVFTLPEGAEKPVQRVLAPDAVPGLLTVDLEALPAPRRQAEAARVERAEVRRPFDLRRGPVLRTLLLRLDGTERTLLPCAHHAVTDGWSLDVLAAELSVLYRGEELAPLPIQYGAYADWQRRWLAGGVLEEHLGYWRERLAGYPGVLELPADRPHPPFQSFRGDYAHRDISRVAVPAEGVHRLARSSGTTSFVVLLAAFQGFLGRLTGQDDVLVGSPVASRNREEIEGLIGFFVNLLVLRTDLSGDPPFAALVERAKETSFGAYAHQDIPFEALVEVLAPERDLSRNPLVQVSFTVISPQRSRLDLGPGVATERQEVHTGTAKFDLGFSLEERDGAWLSDIEYSAALFDRATAERLLRLFETFLGAAIARPETRLADLPLLTPAESREMLARWNRAPEPGCREGTLHGLFAEHARRTPEAVAVDASVAGGGILTYAGLDRRAARLAGALRRQGVGPGDLVALHLERSPEMVVALLAALKAGAAYVPLDPSDPEERLRFTLEDSGARIRIGREGAPDWLRDGGVFVPVEAAADEGLPADPARADLAGPESLAYVIYTSGSSGRPKGVAVPHRAVPRLALDNGFLPLSAADRVAHLSNTAFDAAVLEVWAALLNGAALVVVPREVALDAAALLAAIDRHGITVGLLTAAVFNAVSVELEEGSGPCGGSLRALFTGGEAGDPARARAAWRALPAEVRVMNAYGPTEGAVIATTYRVGAESERWPAGLAAVPIGTPVAATRVHVLDPALRPVPAGIPGELMIGGEGLAHGYWRRPDLTAERFVPDPFAAETGAGPGARLYRSGDRARYLAGGNLEYLGRLDNQLKLRGFRVEPGEIEAALLRHPEVREAAVVLRPLPSGETGLVGFVVGEAGLDCAGLRDWLTPLLPAPMVPGLYAGIAALPRTPAGKVDRAALVRLTLLRANQGAAAPAAPRTPLEEAVAGIWGSVLRQEEVGIQDDFFAAGGHSLLATSLLSRIRGTLGAEVSLADFFVHPTVAGLAAQVEKFRQEESGLAAPPLVPAPRDRPLRLSFAQERLWLIDQLQPGTSVYNSYMPLVLDGRLDFALLQAVLTEIARRHEVLRTTFVQAPSGPVQVIAPPAPWPLPVVDLSGLAEPVRTDELMRLTHEDGKRPFDLEKGPLRRATLVRLAPRSHGLLFNLHHSVCDGWSLEILTRELEALYKAFAAGAPSPLPELPLQYADFADWQRGWLQGEVYDRQLAYWRGVLGARPPVLDLPTDGARPRFPSTRGGIQGVAFYPDLVRRLTALGRASGGTVFTVLLAAFQILLHRLAGQPRISIGTPVANRTRPEIEGLIGFFVNTLVLSTDLSGSPTVEQALARTRDVTLGAFDHQDFPFDKLVAALENDRDPGRQPLFQAMFVFQTTKPLAIDLPGLGLSWLSTGGDQTLFDLVLTLAESDYQGGTAVSGNLAYQSDLFEVATVERWSRALERLAAAMVADPQRSIDDLPLLSEAELRQVLAEAPERHRSPEGAAPVVLDARRRAVPPGVWGELFWLPAGDLPEPDEGAFAGPLGDRLQATGERARFRLDGALERAAAQAGEAAAEASQAAARQAELDERRRQLSSRRSQLSPERLAALRKWVKGKDGPEGTEV